MPAPTNPYQPYASVHGKTNGPGDARPSSLQVVEDANKIGALKGHTILITGCSAGIGVETARALYETGATLFLTGRNMSKLDQAIDDIVSSAKYNKDGPKPQAIELHLDSFAGVRKAAEEFKTKSGGKLNMLIENAGMMMTPYQKTEDGIELQLGANHFGHFLLFQLLKDCLISSAAASGKASRVVVLSSAGHRMSAIRFNDLAGLEKWNSGDDYHKRVAYGQSKTANIYMASALNRHYSSKGIVGVSVHPGMIETELSRHFTEDDKEQLASMFAMKYLFKDASQGGATAVWAAVSDHFEGKNGGVYLQDVGEAHKAHDPWDVDYQGYVPHAYDEPAEEGLWKLSYDVVGLPSED